MHVSFLGTGACLLDAGNNASFMYGLEAEAVLGWGGPEDPVSPVEESSRGSPLPRTLNARAPSHSALSALEDSWL